MTAFVALLRAVNVGGNGKLPMTELIAHVRSRGLHLGPDLYRLGQCRILEPRDGSADADGSIASEMAAETRTQHLK